MATKGTTTVTIIHTATFRSFHQGVNVTLSLRRNGATFLVRCQPCGYPLIPNYDTTCATLAEAESLYTRKFGIGMTGGEG
jgi:hypothetical protein